MSTPDRTWPACLDVPHHIVKRLRVAAADRLERACDNGGEWNDDISERVLDAASVVLAFDIMSLPSAQVATLAHWAIRLEIEALLTTPNEMDNGDAVAARFGVCQELQALRDGALERVTESDGRRTT